MSTVVGGVLRHLLRPLMAMALSLVAGFVASGLLWTALAAAVPWLLYLVLRFGKYVAIGAGGLVIAFFLLDVIAHETETLDLTLDWFSDRLLDGSAAAAAAHTRLCLAWPRLPAGLCGMVRTDVFVDEAGSR
jgi:hypothetical protein